MKKLLALMLVVCCSLSLIGCGKKTENPNVTDAGTKETAENQTTEKNDNDTAEPETEGSVATLEEAEVWLLYNDGSYVEVLEHVPEGRVSTQMCLKDGTPMEEKGDNVFFGTLKLNRGWSLNTALIPEGYAVEDMALKLSCEGYASSVLVTEFGGARTEEELKSAGLIVWDGHYGVMLETRTTYGSGSGTDLKAPSFGLFFGLYLCGKDWNAGEPLMEELAGHLSFFAEDGTPLEQYFDGFDSIAMEAGATSIYALLYRSDGAPYDKTQYKAMCEELRACNPYMIFTGSDGVEQRFELFAD